MLTIYLLYIDGNIDEKHLSSKNTKSSSAAAALFFSNPLHQSNLKLVGTNIHLCYLILIWMGISFSHFSSIDIAQCSSHLPLVHLSPIITHLPIISKMIFYVIISTIDINDKCFIMSIIFSKSSTNSSS